MWALIARFILLNRLTIITVIVSITLFMGYFAQKADITYANPSLLPESDTTAIDYIKFKNIFGQDGSVMVIGIQDEGLYALQRFRDWYELGNKIKKVKGVKAVVSVARLQKIIKNDSLGTFEKISLVSRAPQTQAEVDSIKEAIHRLPFYRGIIYNDSTHSTLMAITFDTKDLNTKNRLVIVDSIKLAVEEFLTKNQVEVHYSGMPYIRTSVARKIQHEMFFFMILAIFVTAIILFLFLRSILPVLFSLVVIIW